MKKLLLIAAILAIACFGLFAQARVYTQKVLYSDNTNPVEITNTANTSTAPGYIVEAYLANSSGVMYAGRQLSTDTASPFYTEPANLRLKKFSTTNENRVTQINIHAFNQFADISLYAGNMVFMRAIWTVPDPDIVGDWWSVVIPAGTAAWTVTDPVQHIPGPPDLTPPDQTLTITSNPTGQPIWLDAADTGFITPHDFLNPAVDGVYTINNPGYTWVPPSYTVPDPFTTVTVNFEGTPVIIDHYYQTYVLHVNGPDGYAVTGPVSGVTDYIATDGPAENNINDLLGYYTIADAPACNYWVQNPIPVTPDMFALVPPPGGKSAASNSRNGSKEDYYQTYEATIEFQLVAYPALTVTSTPAGAAIIKDGVDTGQVTPYTFCPGEAGVYSLYLDGWEWVPENYTVPTLTADLTIDFIGTPIVVPDTYTLTVNGPDGYAIFKNGVDTGQVTDHTCTSNDVADLIGTYTLAAAPAGFQWVPAEWVVVASDFIGCKADYCYTIEFVLEPDVVPGFTFEVNAFCQDWYVANGYIFEPPYDTNTPAFNDPNDLHAEIWFDADPLNPPDAAWTGVYTPYIFGAPGNLPFVVGSYWVQHPDYAEADGWNWQPVIVTCDIITYDWFMDFTVSNPDMGCPVELSSFTATLTAQNYVQLTWVSQTESQMMGYLVYRSTTNDPATAEMINQPLVPATNTSTAQTYTVTDTDVQIGSTYYYWLEAIDYNASTYHGPVSVIVEGEVPPVLPEITSMRNAYPNPFAANGSTNIEVSLKAGENGTVTIYNVLGQTVRTFSVNEGNHMINWNGRDSKGNACGSGIYFYKLSTPSMNVTKKMVIVK